MLYTRDIIIRCVSMSTETRDITSKCGFFIFTDPRDIVLNYFISVPFDTRLSPICKWKHVYLRMHHLTRNWDKGRFFVSPILRGHKQRVSAIDSNGKVY